MNWGNLFRFREFEDHPKPFLEHIEDLRWMVIKILVVLVVMTSASFFFQSQIIHIIERPLLMIDPQRKSLVNFGVTDPFTIAIELSFYSGLILSFPFITFFLAQFVLPALTPAERRMLYPAAGFSLGLFLVGAGFAYYCVLPPTLNYFFNYSKDLSWNPQWSVREYFSFATQFVISFGLAFELPLGILLLHKLGIVDYALLKRTRSFAVVAITVLAAMITPTSDIMTMLLMAAPMYGLYEICIGMTWYLERKRRRQALSEKLIGE